LAGNFLDANGALALGLLTHLVEPANVRDTVDDLTKSGKPLNKYSGSPADSSHPAAAFALNFYADKNMAALNSGQCPDGFDVEDRMVGRQLKAMSRAAPIALKMSSELLDAAISTGEDLDAGLALELSKLNDIFATEDALEGLSALIEGRRPTYTNS
jgi:enoyl-CoA hydratase/carnithine racemase